MSRWCLNLLPWALIYPVFSFEPQCEIQFPAVKSSVITAMEGATVILPVTAPAGCKNFFAVRISVEMSDSETFVCRALIVDDSCQEYWAFDQWTLCHCMPGSFRFQLNITVDRSHNGARLEISVWDTFDSEQSELTFNVTFSVVYPPNVTSLMLESDSYGSDLPRLKVNSSLEVVCLWDAGNPPVTARLLDRHGVEMEGSIYSSGQIRYRFPAVGCQDTGLIRCEAPGASHNMTVTLRVNSVPEISTDRKPIIIEPGDSLEHKMGICTHTSDVSCLMTQLPPKSHDRTGSAISRTVPVVNVDTGGSGFCNLAGTPPDLVLTVRLDNVSKQDEGQWRLTLTNDAGSGRANFVILIKRPPEFQETINMTQVSAFTGEDIQLKFPVKSHTTRLKDCRLVRMTSRRSEDDDTKRSFLTIAAGSGLKCMRFVNLTGTPPDLTLSVRLNNVRKEEEGQWRLELTNDAGVGHMNFSLHIELGAERQAPTVTVVAITVPSLVCVVIVIVVITICIKRASRGLKANVTVREETVAFERSDDRANRTVSTMSQESVNYYHEIPDDIPDEVGESASDGYLVPSPVENKAVGLEPIETTPIYENELPLGPEQEGIAAAAAAADLPPDDVQNSAASRADVAGADNVTTG